MEALVEFLGIYGLPLSGIALAGLVILGILKYAGAFKTFTEQVRHFLYLAISVGFSGLGSGIYLWVTEAFQFEFFLTLMGAILALNQLFYSIYANTSLKDLIKMVLEKIIEYLNSAKDTKDTDKKG